MNVTHLINTTPGNSNQGCCKRKNSEDDEDIQSVVKKTKYSWYVTLESESSECTSPDEDDESIHSIQGQETEFVQDTSDTSRGTWTESSKNGDLVQVEYEVASLSEDDNPFNDLISSSCSEDFRVDFIRGLIAAEIVCDSDLDEADSSTNESRNSDDSEFSPADYWTCMQCNSSNNNPMFRCCEKCWQQRKNFFPPRPKGKKRRVKRQKRKATEIPESQDLINLDSGLGSSQSSSQPASSFSLSQELTKSVDAIISASQEAVISMSQSSDIDCSQKSTNSIAAKNSQEESTILLKETEIIRSKETNDCENLSQDSRISTATTLSVENDTFGEKMDNKNLDIKNDIIIVTKNDNCTDDSDNELCKICSTAPRDAVIIHKRMAHYGYCCHTCAKKMWKTRKQCPLCNLTVVNVIKGYNASDC